MDDKPFWVLDGHTPKRATLREWGNWMAQGFESTKRVAMDTVPTPYGNVDVSTVFLSINHNFMGKGGPVLFETMTFGGVWNKHQWRYRTWDEAQAGHDTIVAALLAGEDIEEAMRAART